MCVAVAVNMALACAARSRTLQDVLMHGQDYRHTASANSGQCIYLSLGGFTAVTVVRIHLYELEKDKWQRGKDTEFTAVVEVRVMVKLVELIIIITT